MIAGCKLVFPQLHNGFAPLKPVPRQPSGRGYAELGSVRLLKDELEARGIKSKSRMSASGRFWGGKPFSRGALYLMLQNRIYRGEIVHKEMPCLRQLTQLVRR